MSTNEHWHIDPHLPVLVVDAEGNCVASSFIGVPGDSEALAKAEARARLIAQAPAMAEALKDAEESAGEILSIVDGGDDDAKENATARLALLQRELRAILAQLEAKP